MFRVSMQTFNKRKQSRNSSVDKSSIAMNSKEFFLNQNSFDSGHSQIKDMVCRTEGSDPIQILDINKQAL